MKIIKFRLYFAKQLRVMFQMNFKQALNEFQTSSNRNYGQIHNKLLTFSV